MSFKPYVFSIGRLCFCLHPFVALKKNNSGSVPVPIPNPIYFGDISFWLTKSDQSVLLQKQSGPISFSADVTNSYPDLLIDSTVSFQTIDGFGFTLTGGSATLINKMDKNIKERLLNELFSTDSNSIGISYLRLSIGASDLSSSVFSYDDIAFGQEDLSLSLFSLAQDTVDLIPVLKQILMINPKIKIMGSPWSPPVWMKDNNQSKGGSLDKKYYPVYAQYLSKYIQSMSDYGIKIDAITIQNEPQNANNNPSLLMSANEQADFIKNNLGPAFKSNAIQTKIIIWDHNCDNPGFPLSILNDVTAKSFVSGSAFHLYGGDISALSIVHNAHPEKDVFFTEQWTSATGNFGGDLKWHIKNVLIGSMRNWSKTALEWNLANDQSYGPHTPGGCTECKGALTIQGDMISRNVSYYIIAHASKFIPTGSIRISSSFVGNLYHVAFLTPAGKKVLIVLNENNTNLNFNINYNGKKALLTLNGESVGTFIW
jgi:glucosylceramidase